MKKQDESLTKNTGKMLFRRFSSIISASLLLIALVVLFLILFLRRLRGRKLQNAILICTAIPFAFSLLPLLLFGTDWITPGGIGVSLCLLLSGIFQGFAKRQP